MQAYTRADQSSLLHVLLVCIGLCIWRPLACIYCWQPNLCTMLHEQRASEFQGYFLALKGRIALPARQCSRIPCCRSSVDLSVRLCN